MKTADVMTRWVISVRPELPVVDAVRLMLQDGIGGLPVIGPGGALVGMITEGDFLRRAELGTERQRPRWLEALMWPGQLAAEYVRTHAPRVEEVMSRDIVSVDEETPLVEVVRLMERHRVKRLPVLRDGKVVGIVSRTDLLDAFARIAPAASTSPRDDGAVRAQLRHDIEDQAWAPRASVEFVIEDGVVHLWGTIFSESQREALRIAAESAPGVKRVEDHLVWVEPISGLAIGAPGEEAAHADAA
jgi:CBS-domain-containing membrane protein